MKIDSSKYPLPNRLRHHTSSNVYLPLSQLKSRPEYYPPLIDKIDWKSCFSNGLPPDQLDIGCGKGKLLLDLAESYPENNFLGIEVRKNVVDWLKSVIEGEKIANCSTIWYSVVNGLPFIENNSIEQIYYLFPDPWPKKKHLKRRAFNEFFLAECFRILKPGGKLFLATDVLEVHEYHSEQLELFSKFNVQVICNDIDWDLSPTNKETFCRKHDIEFFRLICIKP